MTTDYSTVAFWTLITSSIVSIADIIGFIYDIIAKKHKQQTGPKKVDSYEGSERDVIW